MTAVRHTVRDRARMDEPRRVRDLLRAGLGANAFADGVLPSEPQLMAEFGVSRSTVRDALAMLHTEGLIERRKGLGTLVVHRKNVIRMAEQHGVGGLEPGSVWSGQMRIRLLEWCAVPLPHVAAQGLGAAEGDPCLRIEYVALLDGEPLGVATNYVRFPQAAALHPRMFRTDWYAMIDAAGLEIGETTFVWEAALADELDARILAVQVGSAVFLGEQVISAPDGTPYDFALTRGRADRVAMRSSAAR